MKKPSLKDRRREEAREALYRAQLRQEQILDQLMRNATRIKRLRAQLARLDKPALHTGPVSVAEGKQLHPDTLALVTRMARELDDDISDVPGGRR